MNCHRRLFAKLLLVVLGTAAVHSLEIVSMGDSYAAGVGARGWHGLWNYEGPFGCFRSATSYSALFAEMVGADKFYQRGCGGGSTNFLTRERKLPFLSWIPRLPWHSCCRPSSDSDEYHVPAGMFGCERYVKPQIEAVTSTTDLVILTIGANDIGGSRVYLNCFSDFILDEAECEKALDNSRKRVDIYESNLIEFLAIIEPKLNSKAKVVLVNYPLFVMDAGYTLGNISPNPDTQAREIHQGMNQAMHNAATAGNNSNFVMVYNSTAEDFAGHEVDPRLGPFQLNPDRWILEPVWDSFGKGPDGLFMFGGGPEGFHMNNKGNQRLARAMVDRKDQFFVF